MRLFKENGNKNVSLLDSPRPLIFIGHVTKYYVVLKNSLKGICAFQIELEFENVGFQGEGKTGVHGEKPLGARERANNKLNPHMASTPGFEHGSHWWEASALTTAQPLGPPRSHISLCTPRSLSRELSCNQNTKGPPTCLCWNLYFSAIGHSLLL